MTRRDSRKARGFHELPLVFFTALAVAGGGLGGSHLAWSLLGWVPEVPPDRVVGLAGALLAVGLLFSLGHLGRPARALRALRRAGRSPLSNEVLAAALALGSCGAVLALPTGHPLAEPAAVMAGILCLIFLLTLGWVYRLPGQLTWTGLEVVQPLILGITFGTTLLLVGLPEGFQARGELFVLLALSVDGLLVWRRARRIGHGLRVGVPTRPRWMTHRGGLLSLRLVLGVLLPVVAVLVLRPGLALASLSAGILLDRALFYGLAVRASTEAEMKKVEAVLRPGS